MCYKKFSSSYSIAAPSILMCPQLYIDSCPKSLAHIRKDNSLTNTIFSESLQTTSIHRQALYKHFTSCILWFKIHSKLKFKNIWNNTALVYTFKFSHFKKWELSNGYWHKGPHGNLQTSKAFAKGIGYPPQPDGKALLLETILSYVIEHREVNLVPKQKLHTYWSTFMVGEGTLHTTEEKDNYPYHSAISLVVYNKITCL